MIISYIKGIVKNICNPAASILAIINHTSKIDKLAKIGVIHKNKAANLKSGIAVYINKLS